MALASAGKSSSSASNSVGVVVPVAPPLPATPPHAASPHARKSKTVVGRIVLHLDKIGQEQG